MKHFVITDDHLRLKKFLPKHPEIMKVFENVVAGQEAMCGLQNHPNVLISEYVECLFLPLLEEEGVIEADPNKKSGYSSKYQFLSYSVSNLKEMMHQAGHTIHQICAKVTEKDTPKNTLGAYVTGRASLESLNELHGMLREKAIELLNRETCLDSNSVNYELGIVFHRELD